MIWAKASHFSLIKKFFGEELQKNYFGSSKAQLMQLNYKTKELIFGQETAPNST